MSRISSSRPTSSAQVSRRSGNQPAVTMMRSGAMSRPLQSAGSGRDRLAQCANAESAGVDLATRQ